MPLWQILVDSAGGVLLLVLLYGLSLVLRRRWIARDGGTFELSLRARSDRAGRGWVLGLGRYSDEVLEFFRIFSVLPGPMRTYARRDLRYAGSREPVGLEVHALYVGHVVIALETPSGPIEVALAPAALTGLLAWLEAAPPGHRQTII